MTRLERIRGCLLGGAVGDALGAPVEFLAWAAIEAHFGPRGITDFVPAYGKLGAITDDTQMMLFTAEGLLRAYVRGASRGICHPPSVVHHALLRWLLTQDERPATYVSRNGWLIERQELWARRAPGATCLQALKASTAFGDQALNDSKGCGGVMRVAPCAFFDSPFQTAAESARVTHGHPTGYLAAGLFADILARLARQDSLMHAISESLAEHGADSGMRETREAIERVLVFVREGQQPTPARIDAFGGGWVAEEALAIGLWCALCADSFEQGVTTAVNHSGDSDSTGLIAGHLLGIQWGAATIPARWYARLELHDAIEKIASDIERVPRIFTGYGGPDDERISQDYPGG